MTLLTTFLATLEQQQNMARILFGADYD